MLFTIDDTYKIGLEEIDNQHLELINLAIKLHSASDSQSDSEILKEAIEFLCKYVINHFSTEEYYMEKYKCPNYIQHKVKHLRFTNTIINLKNNLEDNPAPETLIKLRDFIIIWFKEHIMKVDKEMGIYIIKNIGF